MYTYETSMPTKLFVKWGKYVFDLYQVSHFEGNSGGRLGCIYFRNGGCLNVNATAAEFLDFVNKHLGESKDE